MSLSELFDLQISRKISNDLDEEDHPRFRRALSVEEDELTEDRKDKFKLLKQHTTRKHHTDLDIQQLTQYESLDYCIVENHLYIEKKQSTTLLLRFRNQLLKWTVVLLIGSLTGILAFLLYLLNTHLTHMRYNYAQDLLLESTSGLSYLYFVSTSVCLISISSFLTVFLAPEAQGSGIPEIKSYLNGVAVQNVLDLKTICVKFIGVVLMYCGGLILGKEGPMVQVGSGIALFLCYCVKFLRWDYMKRDYISCGTAAGIAAAFGAPSGSILFVLEAAATHWTGFLLWVVMCAGFMATLIYNICFSAYQGDINFISFPRLVMYGEFLTKYPYSLWQVVLFVGLAVVGGLLGALFNSINWRITKFRKKYMRNWKFLRMLECVIVAFFGTTMLFWIPRWFNYCEEDIVDDVQYRRYQCPEGQHNPVAELTFLPLDEVIRNFLHSNLNFGLPLLTAYFFLLSFLFVISFGLAIPGGILEPSILIGCCIGRFFGELLNSADGTILPGSFSFIGACAFVGGVTRLTICMVIILLEITNNAEYLLPLMITALVSKFIGDLFNISLYDIHISVKNVPFVQQKPSKHLALLKAVDVMSSPVISFREQENALHIYNTLKSSKHHGFPIITENGKFSGLMLRHQFLILFKNRIFFGGNSGEDLKYDDFHPTRSSYELDFEKTLNLNENEIKDLSEEVIDSRAFMAQNRVSIYSDVPLTAVFRQYRAMGLRHLIVISNDNQPIGIITRKELMTDFSTDLA
jgi:chloride channel 7